MKGSRAASSLGVAAAAITVLALICGAALAIGASDDSKAPSTGAAIAAAESFEDCKPLWTETRSGVVDSGAPDGEARRQADLALDACQRETSGADPYEPSPAERADCINDVDRKDELMPARAGEVDVYFSCMADVHTKERPVYRASRPVADSASTSERLRAAIVAYLQGPSDKESRRGYFTAVPTPITDGLRNATVSPTGVAVLDFSAAFEKRAAEVTTSSIALALLEELNALTSQFEEIESAEFRIEGDCERFWRLYELDPQCGATPAGGAQ